MKKEGKKKIALVGALGCGEATSSGQIIRTNIVRNALEKEYGASLLILVNTSTISKRPWEFMVSFLKMAFTCKDIMIILSINGMKRLWPVFSVLAKCFEKRIYNNVIGGNLLSHIAKHPKLAIYMKTFSINWVQSVKMQKDLESHGVYNTEWLPNAKPINILHKDEIIHNTEIPLRFCTFSRVSKSKGIELAINTIKDINSEAGKTLVTLDIYGKPDDDYIKEFESLQRTFPNFVHYGGVVPFDKSVETLKWYFMLLFPTTFYGEGFPGTIIDAYASGTPVLASDWNCNPEVILDGMTGLLYEHDKPEQLKEKLKWVLEHIGLVDAMRQNCIVEAEKYTMEKVYEIVFDRIETEGNRTHEYN